MDFAKQLVSGSNPLCPPFSYYQTNLSRGHCSNRTRPVFIGPCPKLPFTDLVNDNLQLLNHFGYGPVNPLHHLIANETVAEMTSSQLMIGLLGTCDTKLDELLYTYKRIEEAGCKVYLIDIGRVAGTDPAISADHSTLMSKQKPIDFSSLDRGTYVNQMIPLVVAHLRQLLRDSKLHGIISIGGSSGTSLATAAMRKAIPIGFPKLMVSTMASGDISHYIEETDITMMYSVVDIAGTNSILNNILTNAAGVIAGMARAYETRLKEEKKNQGQPRKTRVGITMFGVTTPGADAVRAYLEKQKNEYEVYVFHATGAGGKAMERLIREHQLDAVVDLTTTEIADELFGGVLTAGPDRLKAAAEAGIPQIVSVGACDMVNFGPRATVPKELQNRNLVEHNPAVTLMRTSADECAEIGRFIAERLKNCKRPELVSVILPVGGISMIAVPGKPFHDAEADKSLFEAADKGLDGSGVEVIRDERNINDEGFAKVVGETMIELLGRRTS